MPSNIKLDGNVLVIPDYHAPFHHPDGFDFLKETHRKYKCKHVVCIGDAGDAHAVSKHTHDTELFSAGHELEAVEEAMQPLYRAWPDVYCVLGNHDLRFLLRAKEAGLPDRYLKSMNELYGCPKGWKWASSWELQGVLYLHGIGAGGVGGALKLAMLNRQSTVAGHTHSDAGVAYSSSHRDLIFGLGVGCLIDPNHRAFSYGANYRKKPILGCGVVTDNGRTGIFEPMNLGSKVKLLSKSKK